MACYTSHATLHTPPILSSNSRVCRMFERAFPNREDAHDAALYLMVDWHAFWTIHSLMTKDELHNRVDH